MNPTESFFRSDLPRHIVADLARFQGLSGSIAFSCGGQKFTVVLGDLDAPVRDGFDRDASVRVWFFGDAFERFLNGEVLVGKKHRMVQGDADVLAAFGKFLQPAHNALSVRFARAA